MRVRRFAAGLFCTVLAGMILFAGSATAQRPECLPGCDPCLGTACGEFDGCLADARADLESCANKCSADPGRCTLTLECVRACRDKGGNHRGQCRTILKQDVQKACGGTCRISRGSARRACNACDGGAAAAVTQANGTGRDFCQERCIHRFVGDCYAECRDRCEGDELALKRCRRGCRDAQCGVLKGNCRSDDEEPDTDYEFCCDHRQDGQCSEDVDCKVTTTSSTSTTTSSTSTTVRGATTSSTSTSTSTTL